MRFIINSIVVLFLFFWGGLCLGRTDCRNFPEIFLPWVQQSNASIRLTLTPLETFRHLVVLKARSSVSFHLSTYNSTSLDPTSYFIPRTIPSSFKLRSLLTSHLQSVQT
jgi:hypothetical protein